MTTIAFHGDLGDSDPSYDEFKHRPLYIMKRRSGEDVESNAAGEATADEDTSPASWPCVV